MDPRLEALLLPGTACEQRGRYVEAPLTDSEAIRANAFYFGHPGWAKEYLDACHRSDSFRERWMAALGDRNGKVVLDLGCGPGNLLATLGGEPAMVIGVDVAPGSLELAASQGYVALRADAAAVPLRSGCADIVAINASIHHCEDMVAVLREAGRLVRPGGMLVTDHDPQRSGWDYRGVARLLWEARLLVYRILGRGFHKSSTQQMWGLRTEIHHRPGDGLTEGLFRDALEPMGFDVQVYRHNHQLGAEVLAGRHGPAEFKYRLGSLLSGRDPAAPESALSLMCVARKRDGSEEPEVMGL